MTFLADDEGPVKRTAHEIGGDLANLSADELSQRIALLQAEIVRLEEERARKTAGRAAAESLFRR